VISSAGATIVGVAEVTRVVVVERVVVVVTALLPKRPAKLFNNPGVADADAIEMFD